MSKSGGLRAEIWAKIEAVEAKIPNFLKWGSCELKNDQIWGLVN